MLLSQCPRHLNAEMRKHRRLSRVTDVTLCAIQTAGINFIVARDKCSPHVLDSRLAGRDGLSSGTEQWTPLTTVTGVQSSDEWTITAGLETENVGYLPLRIFDPRTSLPRKSPLRNLLPVPELTVILT